MSRCLFVLSVLAAPLVCAQDTRNVSEPRFPQTCAVLKARLPAPHGALSEASERTPDTLRLQQAIDGCPQGQAVKLVRAGRRTVFLSGPLRLKAGVSLWVDADTALFASRNPRDYDLAPQSCGNVSQVPRGCKPFLLADKAPASGILGDGAIDGRGGAKLLGQDETWWDLAKRAKVLDQHQSVPRMLVVRASDNFTLYRITLRNSPGFHVGIDQTDGFTAWGVKILTPRTARNTDGIDPSAGTKNVTITHCDISTGDDNVAIKSGGNASASHITIGHNHFYSGHGMSIGSGTAGGVNAVRVTDLTIDGADNGIRIKSDRSRGGLVSDVVYEDVCMRNVTNPIVLTSMYTTFPGNKLPVYRDIVLRDVRSVTPGYAILLGLDAQHPIEATFDNVNIDGLREADVQARNALVTLGPRRGNFVPAGSDVTVKDAGATAPAAPIACDARLVPFPKLKRAPAADVIVPPEDKTLYVAASGSGDYYSVERAIDVAPAEGAMISIAPGTYRETLVVNKPNITLRSANPDPSKTVIIFNKSAGTHGGTSHSATVEVHAAGFRAENLTFANDFNATHPQMPQGSQALALLVDADRAVFHNMRFLGNQDTLYAGAQHPPARQYFFHCYIEGNVDFIFGNGKAVFEDCEVHSTPHEIGFITAQSKKTAEEDSGFVFRRCRLTAEPGVADVWLGRPWRPLASVIFLDTEMGAHITPAGWREWHPGETHSIETAFYAEFNSSGAGAHPSERDPHTHRLSSAEAAQYETRSYLAGSDGWNPAAH